jgi:enoyl-CoA hydratase/carnithine racemase
MQEERPVGPFPCSRCACEDRGMTTRYGNVVVEHGTVARITLDHPARRNALSLGMMRDLTAALRDVGGSAALGIVLAANGPVFSAGHDFADMAGADEVATRELFDVCTEMMLTIEEVPQPVCARVHALATAAGCQLVATCDLAIAAESAAFALPGGKGGLFCHTPLVAVARNIGRKRALEMAFTGDAVDARTAAEWGLVNRVVPDDELDAAVDDLVRRATRGAVNSKAIGKTTFYAQIGLTERDAYAVAVDAMSVAAAGPDAQEGIAAFLGKRAPNFDGS